MSAAAVLKELKAKGNEKTGAIYGRHGHPVEKVLGVSTADMKAMAKKLKGQQKFALDLYATGMMEAMYIAGMVADGKEMSKAELEAWAKGAVGMPMIESYTVPWVTVENAAGQELAMKWIAAKDDGLKAIGWSVYSGLVSVIPDDGLNMKEVEGLLAKVVKEVHTAENRVRKAMNLFVICVGSYVLPLKKAAKDAAKKIGDVSVDVGDTSCKVPVALEYIAKVEAKGKGGKKKTLRC